MKALDIFNKKKTALVLCCYKIPQLKTIPQAWHVSKIIRK